MLDVFLRFLDRLNRVVGWVVSATLGVLVFLVLTAVFYRYVLSSSLSWSGEVARYLCIWIGFLSASIALRGRMHIGLEFVTMMAPPRLRWWLRLVTDTLILAFLVVVTVLGFGLAFAQTRQTSPALMIPMVYPYLSVPVSTTLMALQALHLIVGDLKSNPKAEGV
jgi:TRAP-type C4-dicarboxylate transport system permease small subunit